MYWFMSDASEPNSTNVDHRWIHFKEFNLVEYIVEAMYSSPPITFRPFYVKDFKFGIVSGQIRAKLTKVSRSGKLFCFKRVKYKKGFILCSHEP